MADTEWRNQTFISELILLGFGDLPKLHFLLFLLFEVIYIVMVVGNLFIAVLIVANQHFHTPMYFFLGNLSCLEICYTSTILPKMLASFLTGDRTISVHGCITQFYFAAFFVATECYLLAAMSYDRYVAICKPLHYAAIMNCGLSFHLASGSWISGFVAGVLSVSFISPLNLCGPYKIDHFFCESTQIINLQCGNTYQLEVQITIMAAVFTLPPFVLTLTSYICIISTILRIPSTTGKHKAFSTCSSHLIVVTIFYGTLIIAYLLPKTPMLRDLTKVFSVFFTILTPLANPFIYSLRNKEVKEALRSIGSKWLPSRRIQKSHFLFLRQNGIEDS